VILTANVSALRRVADSGDDLFILRIPLPSGGYAEISLDTVALNAIVEQAGKIDNVKITIEFTDKTKLSKKDRQLVGDELVFEFIIMAVRKDERITDLRGGKMTVTLQLGLATGEDNNERTIFYRDSEGNVKKSELGIYSRRKNGINSVVTFTFLKF